MKPQDWTLLAIAMAQGKGLSPVQLQKALFLLGEEFATEVGSDFYDFKPYHFGPFDVSVYHDVDELVEGGLVSVRSGSSVRTYYISQEGQRRADELRRGKPSRAVAYLERAVEWTQSLDFESLVSAIYKKFPKFKKRSLFRGE